MRLSETGLREWWGELSRSDAEATIKKLLQYGDLDYHAHAMEAMLGLRNASVKTMTEAVLASYVAGKTGRILQAVRIGGDHVDSWHDITCYSMMGRYVRQFGAWP
jgi:hypothetical protein